MQRRTTNKRIEGKKNGMEVLVLIGKHGAVLGSHGGAKAMGISIQIGGTIATHAILAMGEEGLGVSTASNNIMS